MTYCKNSTQFLTYRSVEQLVDLDILLLLHERPCSKCNSKIRFSDLLEYLPLSRVAFALKLFSNSSSDLLCPLCHYKLKLLKKDKREYFMNTLRSLWINGRLTLFELFEALNLPSGKNHGFKIYINGYPAVKNVSLSPNDKISVLFQNNIKRRLKSS